MDYVYIKKDDLKQYKATYELFNKLFKGEFISVDDLVYKIEDLSEDLEILNDKFTDLEEEYEEYRRDNPVRY